MIQHYQSAQEVLKLVREKLATAAIAPAAEAPRRNAFDEVAEILAQYRGYSWVGLYLASEEAEGAERSAVVTQTRLGPSPARSSSFGDAMQIQEPKSEIVVPIKAGARTLGMIDVETHRANAATGPEHALLRQVAAEIAQYLASNPGKLLARKTRERSSSRRPEKELHKSPQSARLERTWAAAGEHSSR